MAAAVLFDYDALTTRELRLLSALNDSKQHTAEAREELYPRVMRTAARVVVVSRCVRGIDARGLHKTNLAALREASIGVTAGVRGEVLCLLDGFGDDQEHPGWAFAEHVGYSTPSHREAILRQGVSPLHRMSFQSLAYQQLAL